MPESVRPKVREDIQVRGEVAMSLVDGLRVREAEALRILGRHGIAEPRAGRWYPLHKLLAAFEEVVRDMPPTVIYLMGSRIATSAYVPDMISDFPSFCEHLDEVYHLNHKGDDIGHYKLVPYHDRLLKVNSSIPYPCEFDRGVIFGFLRRFPPAEAGRIRVDHDNEAPCRQAGDLSCTYHVRW